MASYYTNLIYALGQWTNRCHKNLVKAAEKSPKNLASSTPIIFKYTITPL